MIWTTWPPWTVGPLSFGRATLDLGSLSSINLSTREPGTGAPPLAAAREAVDSAENHEAAPGTA
jgi:hypothetical protein